MKIYDLVKLILENSVESRSSDKTLIWKVWTDEGLINNGSISMSNFFEGISSESITRARRKVQELHPELQSENEAVREARSQKESEKGTFVFREKTDVPEKREESQVKFFSVKSFSNSGKSYTVVKDGENYKCNCPSFVFNSIECKHIKKVKIDINQKSMF